MHEVCAASAKKAAKKQKASNVRPRGYPCASAISGAGGMTSATAKVKSWEAGVIAKRSDRQAEKAFMGVVEGRADTAAHDLQCSPFAWARRRSWCLCFFGRPFYASRCNDSGYWQVADAVVNQIICQPKY